MAYSATLALSRGMITPESHRRILNLFSRAGLTMNHPLFDDVLLAKATDAILKTRDGLLRAAIPCPLGECVFLNDVTAEEMNNALKMHRDFCKGYPRAGAGIDAYVDSSDTGVFMESEDKDAIHGMKAGGFNAKVEMASLKSELAKEVAVPN
jgi:3-dehydroquinate synthase